MPEWVVNKVMDSLNDRGIALKGSRILVLGIAYKKNVDDMRESPAIEIMDKLMSKGASVSYSDPHVAVFPKMRKHQFDLSSEDISADSLAEYDAVLLTTDHDKFDYELIQRHAKLLVDTRGRYLDKKENVVKA